MRKKKGFTLVELLVVIAIIALLMGILMPALARVRQVAYRMVSGTNLAGIGKAILLYANDNDGDYPISGSRSVLWEGNNGRIANWDKQKRSDAYGYAKISDTTTVTVTSCLYLLVKYADVAPKQFVNRADVDTIEFSFAEEDPSGWDGQNAPDLTDVWDFGTEANSNFFPAKYCSYSYHFPFYSGTSIAPGRSRHYPVSQQSNPAHAVAGDRNPYFCPSSVASSAPHSDDQLTDPSWDTSNKEFIDKDGKANATAHQQDGQNVLFNDTHVSFEKLSNCGIGGDNIYLPWSKKKSEMSSSEKEELISGFDTIGWPSVSGQSLEGQRTNMKIGPNDEEDAMLVSEPWES